MSLWEDDKWNLMSFPLSYQNSLGWRKETRATLRTDFHCESESRSSSLFFHAVKMIRYIREGNVSQRANEKRAKFKLNTKSDDVSHFISDIAHS